MRESPSIEELQAGILRFLSAPAVSNGTGRIYSWINPDHPGFVYPEAMGLHLRLFSMLAAGRKDPLLRQRADEVARALDEVTPPSGGIGMDGKLYLFDTCMAVGGLLAYRRLLGGTPAPGLLERMASFIRRLLAERVVVVDEKGGPAATKHHWSTIFGASSLKTVIALDGLAEELGDRSFRDIALEVAGEVVRGCLKDGVFTMGPGDTVAYTHAHCYALEGLLHLRARGLRDTTEWLAAGAETLRSWQNEDGSLHNWQQDPARERAKVGDATSQALRIWIAVDRGRFLPSIERGLSFLASLRSPEAGLYYASGSKDVNSITSVFAAQAMEWYLRGPSPEWVV